MYAIDAISKDDIVCIFGGYVIPSAKLDSLPANLMDYPIKIGEGFYLGICSIDDFDDAEFVNHSCDPSCFIRDTIFLVASHDILQHEEITFDYEANDLHFRGFSCNCGAVNCRKWVGKNIPRSAAHKDTA